MRQINQQSTRDGTALSELTFYYLFFNLVFKFGGFNGWGIPWDNRFLDWNITKCPNSGFFLASLPKNTLALHVLGMKWKSIFAFQPFVTDLLKFKETWWDKFRSIFCCPLWTRLTTIFRKFLARWERQPTAPCPSSRGSTGARTPGFARLSKQERKKGNKRKIEKKKKNKNLKNEKWKNEKSNWLVLLPSEMISWGNFESALQKCWLTIFLPWQLKGVCISGLAALKIYDRYIESPINWKKGHTKICSDSQNLIDQNQIASLFLQGYPWCCKKQHSWKL